MSTGLLLRTPQVLWFGCSLILINVWVRLVHGMDRESKTPARCKRGSWVFAMSLALIGLPLTIVGSVLDRKDLFIVSHAANLTFSGYLVVLTAAGTLYGVKMTRVLKEMTRSSSVSGYSGPALVRRNRFMKRLVVFVIISVALGWLLVGFTVGEVVANVRPIDAPVTRMFRGPCVGDALTRRSSPFDPPCSQTYCSCFRCMSWVKVATRSSTSWCVGEPVCPPPTPLAAPACTPAPSLATPARRQVVVGHVEGQRTPGQAGQPTRGRPVWSCHATGCGTPQILCLR